MTTKDHYSKYVSDDKLIANYNKYQGKYRSEPRESDKATLLMVKEAVGGRDGFSLLDVGCSTGNFLYHCRKFFPKARLLGSDLAIGSIEKCKADSDLSGIGFSVADLLDLSALGNVDVVTANAVAVYFDSKTYQKALESVFHALSPGGAYIGFEWIHPFAVQQLTIVETSEWNPQGLTFRFRPMKQVEQAMSDAGFESVEFKPFVLPIDLPHPGHDADVVTYTRRDEHGERLAFRGTLYQPWCHFVARKAR
jgi:SAM-dependent methyltransferase